MFRLTWRRWGGGGLLVVVGLLPGAGYGQEVLRYSGKVERVDLVEGVVVVGELAEHGRLRRHRVYVTPDTPIVTMSRLRPWEMRGARIDREVAVSLVDVLVGDFVVMESVGEGGRATARRITIVEIPAGSR